MGDLGPVVPREVAVLSLLPFLRVVIAGLLLPRRVRGRDGDAR
jgi:hypothetical protein